MVVFTIRGYGQLSPGDLSQPHSHLEGLSNCTQCHDIGDKVPDSKCLACHTEIQSLINRYRGYHASSEVKNTECIACHSDHHGRKFDMVRFDEEAFNHKLTGYELTGQHAVIDCRQCHIPDFINDPEISKRSETFLGLDQQCASCHDDFHQNTLTANDCATCHDTEAFRPAPFFDHDDTEFALIGQHEKVDCKGCHQETFRNGKRFQEFAGLEFSDCISCHDDPHNGGWVTDCNQCHVESSFSDFKGRRNFDHSTTEFTLRGSHKSLDCFECHQKTNDPIMVFQDQYNVKENQCASCHQDVHEGKFGNDCARCHQETRFTDMKTMDFFDHSVTDYPLEGMHTGVDCKACHPGSYTETIDFTACKNCHEDYHQGEFVNEGLTPDCVDCHALDEGFGIPLYTVEQHQESPFPLEGAHLATPCFACHVSESDDRWVFRNIGTSCVECHEDIHAEAISTDYYPEQKCESCHVSEAWDVVSFDHDQTQWPLTGQHKEVECRQCHFTELTDNSGLSFIQEFNGLAMTCYSCHENVHEDQFVVDGITDCQRCHVTASWSPEGFDHSTTAFPLDGKHAEIACEACHQPVEINGKIITEYKIESYQCIDCHL